MDSDDDFVATPFDPAVGIRFKCGCDFLDRNRDLADFRQATGFILPTDFLEMIGEDCAGTFGGFFRVYRINQVGNRLLLMRMAAPHEFFGRDDTIELIRVNPELFGRPGKLSMFPFGEAVKVIGGNTTTNGFLAFDVRRENSVVFASTS